MNKPPMSKYRMDNDEIFGEETGRSISMKGKGRMGPAGNAISPPEGRAYSGGQAKGDKSTGKGFGSTYSRPGEQPYSNRAYSGGQAKGTKGYSDNEPPTSIIKTTNKMYVDKKGG